ncbi:chromosome segregation protein SMC [bacterium]|nr:chromosome segregation protein SMC [bacterium]
MKLKRLEIFGFKSFAKKLDLRLEGGITAVVGPNGCGKTNVIDSIRWVLGEQRPTQIRLDRMEDVLFKGSDSRRQLGIAEVSLTLDNEDRRLPLDMPEITITRRLFRTGESDYMINRTSCRLSDINDLFMDTGMGTDSYSMFEQNMINSILSDKTEDRRHIFEEAAGVTKYKARRKSALGKLAGIEDDLNRVGDIIAELERRVDSLKRQASKAERYRKLKTDIRERTISIAAFELGKLGETAKEARNSLAGVQETSESMKTRTSQLSAESEQLSLDIVTMEKELEEIAGVFTANLTAMGEKEKELARLGSRIEFLGERAEHSREESRRVASSLEKLAESHGRMAEDLAAVRERLDVVNRDSGKLIEHYRVFEARVSEKSGEYGKIEQEYRRVEHVQAEQRSSLETVKVWGESGRKRLAEIGERSAELEKTIASADSELSRIYAEMELAKDWTAGIDERLGELKTSLEVVTASLEEADTGIRVLREEQTKLRTEHDFLAEIARTYAGYSEGVRNAADPKRRENGVLGVLGDVIAADETYVRAIETALEDRLQNVLVDTGGHAVEGIRFLSEGELGRATFLPVDRPGNAPEYRVPEAKGVIGPAADLVRTEARFRPLVARLLAGVIVVDSLQTAVGLQRRNDGMTFVTLAGEKAGPLGDIAGGRTGGEGSSSNIGRTERLESRAAELEKNAAELETSIENRELLANEADYIRATIREQEKVREDITRQVQGLESSRAHAEAKKDAAAEMLSNLNAEAERIKESFAGFTAEIATLESDISLKGGELLKLRERLQVISGELDGLKTELEERRSEVNEYTVERAALTEKKASLERETKTIQERREALAQSSTRILGEIEETEQESLEAGRLKSVIREDIEKFSAEHTRIKARKDETERRHAGLLTKRSELERDLQNLRREMVELSRRESSYTLQIEQASMRTKAIYERLGDEFFVRPEDMPEPDFDHDFDPEQERLLLEDLRRKVQAIGDVNLAAEADYLEEKKRLDFLTGERDDLVEARKTLTETIMKINKIARQRFLETFELISINFQKTFQEFFDGGVCNLELEQDEDPLEAKILISARPPGKNIRSINLLSSGERALTAISLLFAIYQVKPSPFCILDEVDAPLDDANIDRYLRVIRHFSKTTQFIMVTHNKKTMASADNLYGITMEEPGLSSLVSVRLSRVDSVDEDSGKEKTEEVSVE